ncbi:MAG: MATE family efflux transporter [Ichthyobacteriaceae bacterium]|nr:MATE family efflux transporter [Ichthyobacteriaceae bacterium]
MFEGYSTEFKKNLKIAYPVMLGQLGQVTVGIVDSLMIGKLGTSSLAAVSVANGIFFVILMFGIGLSVAITPLVAEAVGGKDSKKAGKIFSHGLVLNTIMSIIMTLGIIVAMPLLYKMSQPVEVIDMAIPYLQIITLSFIPLMIYQSMKQYAEGLSFTKPGMYATLIGNMVNVALNYVFIFGKFGAPELGLVGAGIGTLASRIAMMVVVYMFITKQKAFKESLSHFSLKNLEKTVFQKLAKIGVPTGLQLVFEVGAFVAVVFIAGLISKEDMAANQIAQSLVSVSYMLASGFGSAATVRVGNQLGEKNYSMLKKSGISNMVLVTIMMVIFGVFFVFSGGLLPSLYSNDSNVISITASLLGIAALFQISDGIQIVGLGALRGLQDVKIPTYLTFVAYWVIALPVGYYFAINLEFGAKGLWIGLGIGLTLSAIFNVWRFLSISNKLIAEQKNETYKMAA